MADGAITIEVSTPEDAAAVTAVLEASYPALLASHYAPDLLTAALPLMTKANQALLRCGTFYVARVAHAGIVGCGGWTPERPGTGEIQPGLGHVRHFATHPDHLRRGIGAHLIARCIADATARGIHALECYSTLCAASFYAAAGFVEIQRLDVAFPGGLMFPAVLMRRQAASRGAAPVMPRACHPQGVREPEV